MGRRRPVGGLVTAAASLVCLLSLATQSPAQSLRVTASSMDLQNQQATLHGFTFADTPRDLLQLVESEVLVPVRSNQDFAVKKGVAYPYARPEVSDFVAQLGRRYREACGEQLVVTSLTRPRTRQPRNASRRSVHPTGMAMDLRRSWHRSCRSWLEVTLLTLEANGVLDAMVESRPPHYHIALFPTAWRQRGIEILERGRLTHYEVASGDTLWKIAQRHNTDVFSVKQVNGLRSNRIYVGQVLRLPSGS